MTVRLLDDPQAIAADASPAGRYAAAFARHGTAHFIANARSGMILAEAGPHRLPVTVDDGGLGTSYVANPHSAYVLYARREMDIVGLRHGRRSLQFLLSGLDRLLRGLAIDRIVHIDNWLLSTNLHGDWQGEHLADLRRMLAARFPHHHLALRSLDAWSSPALLEAARQDGWILLPARQIWVVDDLVRDWRPRNNHDNDRRALARSGLAVDAPDTLPPEDLARIADLYAALYVGRYSALNPVFTPAFMDLCLRERLLAFRLARDAAGTIQAVAGMLCRGDVMTPPVVGYDTTRPQGEALYRIASYLFTDWACARGLRLHGSAGAADFKRRRGARGVIEYMAIHTGHLGRTAGLALAALAGTLERALVPLMRRKGW